MSPDILSTISPAVQWLGPRYIGNSSTFLYCCIIGPRERFLMRFNIIHEPRVEGRAYAMVFATGRIKDGVESMLVCFFRTNQALVATSSLSGYDAVREHGRHSFEQGEHVVGSHLA